VYKSSSFKISIFRIREGNVTVAPKLGQFTTDEIGKGQFLGGNRRNLAEEGVVRKISSPKREADVPNLSNDGGQRAGNMGKGSVAPVLASKSASLLLESPA